jgi:hypothetical protein
MRVVFHIEQRAGIWRVLLDGRFFGDYREKLWAIDGAEEKGRALLLTGDSVQILIAAADGAIESDRMLKPTPIW